MDQFYVSDAYTFRRCVASQQNAAPITISGITSRGEIRAFTGIVQSVEVDCIPRRVAQVRWLVTIC
jgi:hypothetical protein